MKKERDSALEILRIVSMVLIVFHHFCVHSGFGVFEMDWSLNKVVLLMGNWVGVGLNIFFMITGYFLIDKKLKISRTIKLMLQILFYSVFLYIVAVSFNFVDFSLNDAYKNLFPTLFSRYPFASAYLIYSLSSPFINIVLNKFSKRQFEWFLISVFVLWSVIPTFTLQNTYGAGIGKFIMFYAIGAYVRKYPEFAFFKKQRYLLAVVCLIVAAGSDFIYNFFSDSLGNILTNENFYIQTSTIQVLLAYSIFLICSNIKNFSNPIVNAVGLSTFGIYLIHDNIYMRQIIWKNILDTVKYKNSPYFIFYVLFCIVAVFVVCSIIETIRIKFIEKPLLKKLSPILNKLDDKVSKLGF